MGDTIFDVVVIMGMVTGALLGLLAWACVLCLIWKYFWMWFCAVKKFHSMLYYWWKNKGDMPFSVEKRWLSKNEYEAFKDNKYRKRLEMIEQASKQYLDLENKGCDEGWFTSRAMHLSTDIEKDKL